MNNLLISILFAISVISPEKNDDCSGVYNLATYALSHSKKALKAHNFDHQVYYSGKTLESYEKIVDNMENCDCKNATELILDIAVDAEKAADPVDWDRGRYYSKKVYLNTQELITILDLWAASDHEVDTVVEHQ